MFAPRAAASGLEPDHYAGHSIARRVLGGLASGSYSQWPPHLIRVSASAGRSGFVADHPGPLQ